MESIPIIKLDEFLLISIQVELHDILVMRLQDDLTKKISQHSSRGVLIDISSVDMLDSFTGRMIASIASISKLLDAETVVVGMQPDVAITLVELGMSLSGVFTAINVDKGMELLRKRVGYIDDIHDDFE